MKRHSCVSFVLSLAVMLSMSLPLALPAFAATSLGSASTTISAGGDYIIDAQSSASRVIKVTTSDPVTIKGSSNTTQYYDTRIIVQPDSGTSNLTLENVNIKSGMGEPGASSSVGQVMTILGDCNLTLVGDNTLRPYLNNYSAGIRVPPSSSLTIDGSGSLTVDASSQSYTAAIGGSYVGGTSELGMGNITINGGTITAKGGKGAAGIGTSHGQGNIGDITINGGTVNAEASTNTSYAAAAIGGANGSGYGNITINGGNVTAKSHGWSYGCGAAIGAGDAAPANASLGVITIAGGTVTTANTNSSIAVGLGSNASTSATGNVKIVLSGGTLVNGLTGSSSTLVSQKNTMVYLSGTTIVNVPQSTYATIGESNGTLNGTHSPVTPRPFSQSTLSKFGFMLSDDAGKDDLMQPDADPNNYFGSNNLAGSGSASSFTATATSGDWARSYIEYTFGTGSRAVYLSKEESVEILAAPTLTGPDAETLVVGYAATDVSGFTADGTPAPTITLSGAPPQVTWDSINNKLVVAPGLAVGTYSFTITASNGVSPAATIAFTLTVRAALTPSPIQPPYRPTPSTPLAPVNPTPSSETLPAESSTDEPANQSTYYIPYVFVVYPSSFASPAPNSGIDSGTVTVTPSTVTSAQKQKYVVNEDGVKKPVFSSVAARPTPVYSKWSTKSEKLTTLHEAAVLTIIGGRIPVRGSNQAWYRVLLTDGRIGFVQESSLQLDSNGKQIISAVYEDTSIAYVLKSMKLFDSVSAERQQTGIASKGSAVIVLRVEGDYALIQYGSSSAYIRASALDVVLLENVNF